MRSAVAWVTVAVVSALLVLMQPSTGSGQVPPAPTPLPSLPLPSEIPTPFASDEPTHDPRGQHSPTHTPASTPMPRVEPQPMPSQHSVQPPTSADPGTVGLAPDVVVGGVRSPGDGARQPDPEIAPPAFPTPSATWPTAAVSPLAAALPGSFGVGLLAVLAATAVAATTRPALRSGLISIRHHQGGTDVPRTRRWRLWLAIALLAAATIVGVVGYLRISIETLVPAQIVYLTSAGFAVVILAVAGGSLLVGEQLRADEERMAEVETSIALLAEAMRPFIQAPPRPVPRGGTPQTDGGVETPQVASSDP